MPRILPTTLAPVCIRKQKIPKAVREQVWLRDMGRVFEGKCKTQWCQNTITIFDFQCGHNIPESKGGPTTLDNIIALCCRCNTSMGNQYNFSEWNNKFNPSIQVRKSSFWSRFLCRD